MKRLLICAGLAAALFAVPAHAHKGDGAGKPERAAKVKANHGGKCTPRAVGFNARGLLVASTLNQTSGQDTAKHSDDRYDGTVEVDVKKANHGAPTGMQTYAVTGVRVNFADADEDGTADTPQAGDRVKVHGKLTRLHKRCDASGFTPEVKVKRVQFKGAPAPDAGP